jgi:hypothetical protein
VDWVRLEYPQGTNPQNVTRVSEKESPSICLLKLHLTAEMLSIRVAGVANFFRVWFINDLDVEESPQILGGAVDFACWPNFFLDWSFPQAYEVSTRVCSGEINSYSIPRHLKRRPIREDMKFTRYRKGMKIASTT